MEARPASLRTRYARSGSVHVAYQVFGEGEIDLVFCPGFVSNIETYWEEPSFARWLNQLASFSRVITFDKRGTGLSDRVESLPTMEERMDDVRAVMDAAGSQKAAVFGLSEGGSLATLFAAHYPERCKALVLWGAFAKFSSWFSTPEKLEKFFEYVEKDWGTGANLDSWAPSKKDDPVFREWFARRERTAASPAAAVALMRMNSMIDISGILPYVRVPTLVIHRTQDPVVSVEGGRQLAKSIPNARLIEVPGIDHLPYLGEDSGQLTDEVAEFLTGVKPAIGDDRVLATILFTDIVGATERAAALGDQSWRNLLGQHNAIVRRELERYRGKEIDTAGDGFMAAFDGPARGIRCAQAIVRALSEQLQIEIRAGLHTGECELLDGKYAGLAVHIGARVAALASSGEVLVSNTVKDLVAGSGLQFSERGSHTLKGVPGQWQLFASNPG